MLCNFNFDFSIEIKDSKLKNIIAGFLELQKKILEEFVAKVLIMFAEEIMRSKIKPFHCNCGNSSDYIWKTRHGKLTKIETILKAIHVPQLQIGCKICGARLYITRFLLGMDPRARICEDTSRKLGLIGALTTFRVSAKIASIFGWTLDKMTIWKCVQKEGAKIEFNLDENECAHGEADGTGIPIQNIKNRGKELKVLVQLKKSGGVRIAGLSIGQYDGGWEKLFKPLKKQFEKFKEFLLVTDGDCSILKGLVLSKKVKIIFQRCLWHIPHQLKYCMWQDKIKRKTIEWNFMLSEILDITAYRPFTYTEDQAVIEKLIETKKARVEELVLYCENKKYNRCKSYLKNASNDLFTAVSNKLNGKTTSRVERVMRTVNLRINVGKWGLKGALNASKIRLAYYYNGYDVV